METRFAAPGITCEGCAGTIKQALGTIPGVSGVSVDVGRKTVRVLHDEPAGRDALASALERAGYPATVEGHEAVGGPSRGLPVLTVLPSPSRTVIDPVCGMQVDPASAAGRSDHEGTTYHFCSAHCKQKFDRDPAMYLGDGAGPRRDEAPAPPGTQYTCPMHPQIVRDRPGSCPICGMALEPMTPTADDANPELAEMSRRFWICLALTAPPAGAGDGRDGPGAAPISYSSRAATWVQLALATPVVLWGGWPFFVRGLGVGRPPQPEYVHADRAGHRGGLRLQPRRDPPAGPDPGVVPDPRRRRPGLLRGRRGDHHAGPARPGARAAGPQPDLRRHQGAARPRPQDRPPRPGRRDRRGRPARRGPRRRPAPGPSGREGARRRRGRRGARARSTSR